jgi:hypothetical protein
MKVAVQNECPESRSRREDTLQKRTTGFTVTRLVGPLSWMLVVLLAPALTSAQTGPPPPLMPRGLINREAGVSPGYVLFGPLRSSSTYLIDNDGRVVHEWKGQYAGGGGYLLENGNLLRMGRDPDALHFRAGGVSGYLQEVDWEGRVVWEWKLSDERRILHHDIKPLANGNILALAWEAKSREKVLRAGRRPETAPEQGLHVDWVLEIEPVRPRGAKIVWEWHVWDHLVQDRDPNAPHYGDPAKYAGRLDLNAVAAVPTVNPRQLAQLQALGYVPEEAVPADLEADFLHVNSIDHHAELDQFVLSVPALGEIWVIDHSTSTAQAAGSGRDLGRGWGPAPAPLLPARRALGPEGLPRRGQPHDLQQRPQPARRPAVDRRRDHASTEDGRDLRNRGRRALRARRPRLELAPARGPLLSLRVGRRATRERQHHRLLRDRRNFPRGHCGGKGRLGVPKPLQRERPPRGRIRAPARHRRGALRRLPGQPDPARPAGPPGPQSRAPEPAARLGGGGGGRRRLISARTASRSYRSILRIS